VWSIYQNRTQTFQIFQDYWSEIKLLWLETSTTYRHLYPSPLRSSYWTLYIALSAHNSYTLFVEVHIRMRLNSSEYQRSSAQLRSSLKWITTVWIQWGKIPNTVICLQSLSKTWFAMLHILFLPEYSSFRFYNTLQEISEPLWRSAFTKISFCRFVKQIALTHYLSLGSVQKCV